MFEYNKILYAIDVNNTVTDNCHYIEQYALKKRAALHIVSVHKTIFDYGYSAGVSEHTPNQIIKMKIKHKLNELTQDYKDKEHITIKLIENDSIAEGIVNYVHKCDIDLLVLNGHHHGMFGRMGSVASKISNNAPCDVLILKNV